MRHAIFPYRIWALLCILSPVPTSVVGRSLSMTMTPGSTVASIPSIFGVRRDVFAPGSRPHAARNLVQRRLHPGPFAPAQPTVHRWIAEQIDVERLAVMPSRCEYRAVPDGEMFPRDDVREPVEHSCCDFTLYSRDFFVAHAPDIFAVGPCRFAPSSRASEPAPRARGPKAPSSANQAAAFDSISTLFATLSAQPAVLTTKTTKRLALGARRPVVAATLVEVGLADPVTDDLVRALEIPSYFC